MKPQFSFKHKDVEFRPLNKKERQAKAPMDRRKRKLKGLYLGLKPLVLSFVLFTVVIAALSF